MPKSDMTFDAERCNGDSVIDKAAEVSGDV